MGSDTSTERNHEQMNQQQLKQSIQQNISNGRLKMDHQANIYAKCEYLKQHYDEYCQNFQQFFLTHNMIDQQLMNLLSKMSIGHLKTLALSSNNDINCEALKPIKLMPLKNLQYLFLDHNLIGNDGCFYLTTTNLQSLLTLDLNDNKIEDEGCRNLAKANLPNLRTLLICRNNFQEKGLMYLSKGEWPLLAFAQAKQNKFEPNKQLEKVKFRSQVKVFRLEIQ